MIYFCTDFYCTYLWRNVDWGCALNSAPFTRNPYI